MKSESKLLDQFQIDDALSEKGVYFLTGEITDENITDAVKWLTYHEYSSTKSQKLLTFYINSMGGSLYDAFALIDVMRKSRHNIQTIGVGCVMSSAFLIFAAGDPGQRYIGKYASAMMHQYTTEYSGKHHDLIAMTREFELIRDRMVNVLKEFTGLDTETVKSKLLPPTDVWLTPEELLEFGVADYIF